MYVWVEVYVYVHSIWSICAILDRTYVDEPCHSPSSRRMVQVMKPPQMFLFVCICVGSKLLNITITTYSMKSKNPDMVCGDKRQMATGSQILKSRSCMETPKVLVHHYLDRFLHSCPAKLYELPQEAAASEVGVADRLNS